MSETRAAHEQTDEQRRIAQLEAALASATSELVATRSELAAAQSTIERLRGKYLQLLEKVALLERRILVGKAERVDTSADQLVLAKVFEELAEVGGALEAADAAGDQGETGDDKTDGRTHRKKPPVGRRDLSKSALPLEVVDLVDPEQEGQEIVGYQSSYRLARKRGGFFRVELRRAVTKASGSPAPMPPPCDTSSAQPRAGRVCIAVATCACPQPLLVLDVPAPAPTSTCPRGPRTVCARLAPSAVRIVTAQLPKELVRRGLLAPSMIAYVLAQKYCMGVPFHRLEQQLALEGAPLDRATMCRYAEDVGATLGCIVEAQRKEALASAFCLSTDATGVAIQPTPLDDGKHQPCRKGHFFVTLADRDHVFFDYTPKHDGLTAWNLFKGFSGYIQADAHAIYDALFRGTPPKGADDDTDLGPPPREVACWAHARRKFWEAAVCKHTTGLEGLRRINAIFQADKPLAQLPPAKRKRERDRLVRPLVDDFFVWARDEQAQLVGRGLVATALGYARNHEQAFRTFLEDGRLRLDNNLAESALRPIAVGRNAWLFCGSDDHASAAANIFSLVASCKLHRLDPEAYLTDVIRLLPYWPSDRYLELAPKYWAHTRERIDPVQLARPLGRLAVPPPLAATQQETSAG